MIQYLSKLEEVADAVEAKRGPFALFGLFLREDSFGQWDLVVSAPWLEEGKLKALGEFVEILARVIGQEAMLSFSRVVTLNRDEPALRAILDEVGEASLPLSKQGHNLFGLPIEDAYVLRAWRKWPPKERISRMRVRRRAGRAAPR
jgi:hypothetical protein